MNTIYLHPMIVHFPIALLIIGAMAALASRCIRGSRLSEVIFQFAGISIIIGVISTAIAILSGFLFTKEMVGILGEIRSSHLHFAFISLCSGTVTAILMGIILFSKAGKKPIFQNLALLCSLLTAVMIGITGHYGGMMVFA